MSKHLPNRQCPFKTLLNSIIIFLFVCSSRNCRNPLIWTFSLSAENNPFIKGIGLGLTRGKGVFWGLLQNRQI